MATTSRNLWHLGFASLVRARAPTNVAVQLDVRLTVEPQRADVLLLRKEGASHEAGDAGVLRGLWPLLGTDTVLEYKSPARSAFRRGDLLRLWGYGVQHHVAQIERLSGYRALTLVLVVASITRTLVRELAEMDWVLVPLGGGYGRIDGAVYTTYLVVTDEVAEAEQDDFLRIFSHRPVLSPEARRWLQQWVRPEEGTMQDVEELEGYDEMLQKLLDSLPVERRLAGLTPEERLAGLAPEERLAGLSPAHQLLALSDEALRGFPDEHLRSLPAEVQDAIRKRIGRPQR
ncbi:hypothetical protein BE20_19895 [Sorangium cellulosum]|uniref:Uncharacterized protein n=1 Tax=Sorangium cellulosum TaxID=56 RepID=A0A150SB81_SORCE|nr:hypothetical protein BE20_19895 [Sorangium cellulosum]KYG02544.1 hypothetical protein BE18_45550 [Sorangium cellulosum]